nr:MAG TPA: hypothetical protein [Caudoviricetes sp.]
MNSPPFLSVDIHLFVVDRWYEFNSPHISQYDDVHTTDIILKS